MGKYKMFKGFWYIFYYGKVSLTTNKIKTAFMAKEVSGSNHRKGGDIVIEWNKKTALHYGSNTIPSI
jgi:hypothetical protein